MTSIRKLLATNVRKRRKSLGYTLDKLAELAGLSWGTVQAIESAKVWAGDGTVKALAGALQCSEADLFFDPNRQVTVKEALERLRVATESDENQPQE
jgi:transcriptional regulator with XRE-family HTH domain